MQTELVRSLQIARENETAVLDLLRLHEDVIVYKRNNLDLLDDLRQRFAKTPVQPFLDFGQFRDRSPTDSHTPAAYVQDIKTEAPIVVVPELEDPAPKRTLGRLFSMKRGLSMSRKPSTSSTHSRMSIMAPFEWLGPAIHKNEEDSMVTPIR